MKPGAPPLSASERKPLLDFLEHWRQLTQAETEAIERSRWTDLDGLHAAKQALQINILAAINALGQRFDSRDFATIIEDLIQMERQNHAHLSAQLRTARAEGDEWGLTASRLRQLKNAYSLDRGSVWHSYS
jgi:hypothetical protein